MYVTPNVCLVRQLGEGGMGSVWLADHLSLNTRVAVKFVSADLVKTEPTILERFKREAALCAQIKSPHVVQTYDHGVMQDGRPYIVMELLEGESLQDRLERAGPLNFADAKQVVTQTCKALTRAHKLGIIHRDIKPDNLFLTPDEDEPFLLKVLDFGIAKQTGLAKVSKMTSTGSMIGTPEYMSPEQVLSGESVDFRSDLWAVTVVAYHCLTGSAPFQAETLGSLCVAIAHGRFKPPSQVRPELLPAIDSWFSRALAVDATGRHASAKELAQTFARALFPGEAYDEMMTTTGEGLVPGVGGPRASGQGSGESGAFPGNAPAAVVTGGMRTPSPTAMNATMLGDTAGRSTAGTAPLLAAGILVLGCAGAYFFLTGPTRNVDVSGAQGSAAAAIATTAVTATVPVSSMPSSMPSSSPSSMPSAAPSAAANAPGTRAPHPQGSSTSHATTSGGNTSRGTTDRGF